MFMMQRICLSVVNFDTEWAEQNRTEWAKTKLGHLWQKSMSQKIFITCNAFIACYII